LKKKKKGNTYI